MESSQANVQSIDALARFRAALVVFSETAAMSLEEVNSELQRSLLWLRDDRNKYWQKRVRECADVHTQARLALKRREIFDRALSGSRSSCVDERKALKKAEMRLREAEFRYQRVKSWTQQLEKAASDYKGQVKCLTSDIEVTLPNARAMLDRMVDALEKYVALAPPEPMQAAPTVGRETGESIEVDEMDGLEGDEA